MPGRTTAKRTAARSGFFGDNGIDRKLRGVGARAGPVFRGGGTGLVVEDDVARWLVSAEIGVNTVDTDVDSERAYGDIVSTLLTLLDGEGCAVQVFKLKPVEEKPKQALALGVDVGEGPADGWSVEVLRKGNIDGPIELRGAIVVCHGCECSLGFDLGPEMFEDRVHQAAAFAGVQAKFDGIGRGGEEALLRKGSEPAGCLGLKDGCTAAQHRVGRRWDGCVVGECVEHDGRWVWLYGSDVVGLAGLQRQRRKHWRWTLVALSGLPRVAEQHGGSAGGYALGNAAGVGGIACGVYAGHGELALHEPGEKRIGVGRKRPSEIAGAEKPKGVETGTGGLEGTHNLNWCVARLGREEGFGCDAFERCDCVLERDARAIGGGIEVEGGELVEGALPLAASLEFDAVEVTWQGPASGFEQVVDSSGPVCIGATATG